jgi:NAD(P)-dependent dehydrogenase (short-subunit alcohol dehydrogenase family)
MSQTNAGTGAALPDVWALFSVRDLSVVITGGASGIGLGFAEALAQGGALITILDMNAERIANEVARLQKAGYRVRGTRVDVTDHAALDAAFDAAESAYGKIDVVFANAGIDPGPGFVADGPDGATRNDAGSLEAYTDERWQKVIDVNLTGVFATVRAAARKMKPRKSGRIIITTSGASRTIAASIGSAYMAAKAGAAHFMRTAALELAGYNITVNAIAPGYIVTNIGGGHAHNPAFQTAFAKTLPMHRVAYPVDLCGAAIFLASKASNYVTGQEIGVDGGLTLGRAD